ncbi:MAG TPA: hypothetical protein VF157_05820 [Chloroflexota bacterium]
MTEPRAEVQGAVISGVVVDIDYDADTISVELDDGRRETYPFEMFDSSDVYQAGQRFELRLDHIGDPSEVSADSTPPPAIVTVSGYVESIDEDDELVWVYVRGDEGWQRKVMPLSLFEDSDLARRGAHFLLEIGEDGTPSGLRPDEAELEMLPQSVEQTKPRWADRPAAEAEPES